MPFDIKIINNLSGYSGTYPAFKDEEVIVKPTNLGAGIDQKRLAVYTLTREGNGLDQLIAFTNTGQELTFIADKSTGYALMTYTPINTSQGYLYDLIDGEPGLRLLARNITVYRSDSTAYPPTSFPQDPNGMIEEAVTDLGEGLHPGGFTLGNISWGGSGNLGAGYTSYNADGYNSGDRAYINWTKIVRQFGDGATGLRAAKITFREEIGECASGTDDIGGDTGRLLDDQAVRNAAMSYIFSRK